MLSVKQRGYETVHSLFFGFYGNFYPGWYHMAEQRRFFRKGRLCSAIFIPLFAEKLSAAGFLYLRTDRDACPAEKMKEE